MTELNPERQRSILPWIFLALWLAWVLFLGYMGRHEWGQQRPEHPENYVTPNAQQRAK